MLYMARTIAVSEHVYSKLKELKEALGVGYSELIEMLIEVYERARREELEKLIQISKISDSDVKKVKEVVRNLRERSWW